MGEFLASMPKATGTRGNVQEVVSGGSREAPPAKAPATLAEIGITKKQSARAQKLAAIPADEFQERVEAAKVDSRLTVWPARVQSPRAAM